MRRKISYFTVLVLSSLLFGCASSIVDGEGIRTSNTVLPPKPENAAIEIYFSGKNPERPHSEIGRVSSRAWVLEKGINALKENARNDFESASPFDAPHNKFGRFMKYSQFSKLERQGLQFDLFEEIFQKFNAPAQPLVCVTPVVNGEIWSQY